MMMCRIQGEEPLSAVDGSSRSILPETARAVIWILLSVMVLAVVAIGALYWLPASVDYTIKEQYTFSAADEEAGVYLAVLLPRSGVYQDVIVSSVQWSGTVSHDYERYVEVVRFEGQAKKGISQDAIVEFDVTLKQGRTNWEAPLEDFQLQPQYNIESDHPLIVSQASRIVGGDSKRDTSRIYDFMTAYTQDTQGRQPFSDSSALEAYLTGADSCGQSANLMVALCRASGIPAQTVIGILFPDQLPYSEVAIQSVGHPAESHAWVEFCSEDGWTTADPGYRVKILRMLLFGRIDGRHLSYGEAGQLGDQYAKVHLWALRHGRFVGAEFDVLKYIASADSDGVTLSPMMTVSKGWDGRWFNLLVAWLSTTFVLYRLNVYQVRKLFGPSGFSVAAP